MRDNYILNIEDAVVRYKDTVALKGVCLQVSQGEFVGIIGPNGSGKTTLFKAITGLVGLKSGKIEVFSKSIDTNKHAVRKKVGFIPEIGKIDPRIPVSVGEMVTMGRYSDLGLLHWPKKKDLSMVDEALDLVEIKSLMNRPVGHLSAGELQRAVIAHYMVRKPSLFLLDEPTTSLDWKARADIVQLMHVINKAQGLTIMMVSHDLATLPVVCTRVVLMKNGLIVNNGIPEKMLNPENLAELYDLSLTDMRKRLSTFNAD